LYADKSVVTKILKEGKECHHRHVPDFNDAVVNIEPCVVQQLAPLRGWQHRDWPPACAAMPEMLAPSRCSDGSASLAP